MPESDTKILVSVVVIGRNEGARLRDCLASVTALRHETFQLEAIYVDSGSTDNSLAIARELGIRTIALNPERPTAAVGRNAGWRASSGDFVFFLDGDCVVHPEFLEQALPWFDDAKTAAVFGERRERYPDRSMFNRVLDLDWDAKPGIVLFCGGDAIFRRKALEDGNGYDDTLIAGEEPDLCRRLHDFGYYVRCIDVPMSLHDIAMYSVQQYWRRALRSGHAFAEISSRYKNSNLPMWYRECRRNMLMAATQAAIVILVVALSVTLRSWIPAAVLFALAALAVGKTMWGYRHRTNSFLTLMLYGVHGHIQQVPIAIGQLGFYLSRENPKGLIEYK